jgi:hypothetical protein
MAKHLSCKRTLLIMAAVAATALAAPSFASAVSWGPIGTTHVLDSSDLEFTIHSSALGPIGAVCTAAQLHLDVISATDVTITDLGFPEDCHGTDNAAGCTVTAKATRLHWTMTAPATDNIMIHGVHIDLRFETRPPAGSASCLLNGGTITITGTLRGGVWDTQEHELTFRKPLATGLTAHSALGNNLPVTVSGTFRDTTQSLTLE